MCSLSAAKHAFFFRLLHGAKSCGIYMKPDPHSWPQFRAPHRASQHPRFKTERKKKNQISRCSLACVCVCECLSLSIEVNKMKSIIKNAGEWRHIAIRWCLMWSCKRDIKWEDVVALFGRLSWGRRHGHRHWRFVSASRATHEKTFRRFCLFLFIKWYFFSLQSFH